MSLFSCCVYILYATPYHSLDTAEAFPSDDYDDSYTGSNQSDISLGSNDTDIDEEEVRDIEQEAATMPTPKPTRKTSNKAAKSNDPVMQLAESLAKTSINCAFSYSCPKVLFTCRDGNKDAAVFELHAPLPKEYMKHVKVLPGGMKLSVLFGYPKVLASERAHRKMLAMQGINYDPNLARVAARSSQVTHLVFSKFGESEDHIEGEPQIVPLRFKCPEGHVTSENILWMSWPIEKTVLYKNARHKQFLNIMAIKLNSERTYATERAEQNEVVLEDSEESEDDRDEAEY